MTPEERANQYAEKQMEVFNKFLSDFAAEEKELEVQPNFDDKRKEFEKTQKEEIKRQEKLVRRELNEFEDLFSAPANSQSEKGIKQLTDRMMKSIAEIKKIRRVNDRMQEEMSTQQGAIDDIKSRTEANMKVKKTLHSLCNAILKKNGKGPVDNSDVSVECSLDSIKWSAEARASGETSFSDVSLPFSIDFS